MREIRLGLEKRLDVKTYINDTREHLRDRIFTAEQMKVIREGLEEGIDVSRYTFVLFDENQMEEVKKVLKRG